MRYAIITGTGRSGTNWLLDTFDASPQTHCRNEPHGIQGSALHRFPMVWKSDLAGSVELYREQWDTVATTTAREFGVRDHHVRYPKPYLYPWAHRGVGKLMTSTRPRAIASRLDRRLAGNEWELPRWLGSRRRLESALGVLKIIIDAPLVDWLTTERPEVPLVHIVRHPGGRLNSWLTRLVGTRNEEERLQLQAARTDRLQLIRAYDELWRELIPEPATMSQVEIELWFWRYANETTWLAGRDRASYRLVRFDDLTRDPLGQAETLFAHLGLDWTPEVQTRVAADSSRSVFGEVTDSRAVSDAWRSGLDAEHLEAIDRVTAGSSLMSLFG